MNANFDADLELLELGHCTAHPRDAVDDLRLDDDGEREDALDEPFPD
jgi:hypothetical protein